MSIAAQYLVTAVIGVKGTNVTYDRSTAGSPATRERTRSGRTRLSIRWCETLSGLESAQPRAPPGGGRWRGTDAPVIAGPARPAGQLAARPGRPGRCACRSDRREAAAYVDSGPWRCAPLERTGVPQPSQRPVPTAAELRRLAMEPDQLAGEQCLNAEGLVHEHPPISGGRPASRPRCATGAHCDIRRSVSSAAFGRWLAETS